MVLSQYTVFYSLSKIPETSWDLLESELHTYMQGGAIQTPHNLLDPYPTLDKN